MELLSHPDKKLSDHLIEVACIARSTIESQGFNFQHSPEFGISKKQLSNLVWLAGSLHDLGKATPYFQDYIRNPDKIHSNLKNHALLSSLFAYFIARKYADTNIENKLFKELIPIFVFTAVKRHHGKIGNLDNEILIEEENVNLLKKQIVSIDKEIVTTLINIVLAGFSIEPYWDNFLEFFERKEFDSLFEDFSFEVLDKNYLKLSKDIRIELFYLHQTIYSALLYADKNDVILNDLKSEISKTDINHRLEAYRTKKNFNNPVSEINRLKNEVFNNSLSNLEIVFNPNQHIYSITLPTGLGKTLTSFAVADKLRKLAKLHESKIIINIPYTSIIDQNFEVYQEVLNSTLSQTIIKHHHLSDPVYKNGNENIFDFDKSQFLIETWQSETVVTTFVQFLESILSMDKAKLMKLVHLKNSVVLLDEIQTIPYPLWESVRESFKTLGKSFNIYFILISATQPLIFNPGDDIIEVVPDYQKYFSFFNRTKLYYQIEKISFDRFISHIVNYCNDYTSKSVLVILNTKESSRQCFETITDLISDNSEFYYLSTLITPFERKKIIGKVKEKSVNRKIIVSTQLIEAGVDISVDTVFRQISPVDSIIQSAGRANRYNEKDDISDVFIYEIEELIKSTNTIYGSDLIIKTKNVLSEFKVLEESEYLQLIKKYFIEVRKQSMETSSDLLKAVLGLKFQGVNLELIKERKTESVFIQLNEQSKEVWEKYLELNNNNKLTPWERKAKFSDIKSEFYDYVINVPIPFGELKINFDSEKIFGFYISLLENPSDFYNYNDSDFKHNLGYVKKQTMVI
jgi:CRISPR-associated endonuclease/helicase Cas3